MLFVNLILFNSILYNLFLIIISIDILIKVLNFIFDIYEV